MVAVNEKSMLGSGGCRRTQRLLNHLHQRDRWLSKGFAVWFSPVSWVLRKPGSALNSWGASEASNDSVALGTAGFLLGGLSDTLASLTNPVGSSWNFGEASYTVAQRDGDVAGVAQGFHWWPQPPMIRLSIWIGRLGLWNYLSGTGGEARDTLWWRSLYLRPPLTPRGSAFGTASRTSRGG